VQRRVIKYVEPGSINLAFIFCYIESRGSMLRGWAKESENSHSVPRQEINLGGAVERLLRGM
jgi:hypothetical protein